MLEVANLQWIARLRALAADRFPSSSMAANEPGEFISGEETFDDQAPGR
jgi:hypothetical protein